MITNVAKPSDINILPKDDPEDHGDVNCWCEPYLITGLAGDQRIILHRHGRFVGENGITINTC